MSTRIYTIYWALCRWQELYTIWVVAPEPLVSARYCAKHLICILSFKAQNSPRKSVLVLFQFDTWGKWVSEWPACPKKVIQLVGVVQAGTSLTPNFSSIVFDTWPFDTFSAHEPMCTGPRCAGLDCEACPEPQETEESTWLMHKGLTRVVTQAICLPVD